MNQFVFLSIMMLSISTNSYGETAKEINKDIDDIITNHQKLSSVENCLKVAINKENLEMTDMQITLLLFDQISKNPKKYQKTEATIFCKSIFDSITGPIKKEIGKPKYDDLGAAGEGFAIKNVLLKFFYQKNYAHFEGHSDFTRRGFKSFFHTKCTECIGATSEELLIRASQAPDLYHWKDEKYHAHTIEKTNNADESQKVFLCQIQELMTNTDESIENFQVADALVYFGEILHMLQDLVFHQGMTMTEHSVRSFLERNDPDQPNNSDEKKSLFSAAEQATVDALDAFENRINDNKKWNLIMSTNIPDLNIENKIDAMLENYDFTTLNILAYWSLHLPYKSKPPRKNYHKFRWNVGEVQQTALSIINRSKAINGCK